jgi:ankyrin repeat protein
LLVENGANVNIQTESGKTPLMLAAFAGKINIIKVLRSYKASYGIRDQIGLSTLHYAVDGGNLTAIRYILNDGHEVDPVDKSGWTPLIRACSIDGSIQVVSILLTYKANVHAIDNEKKNSLTIAVINNNLYLTKMLVEHGANFMATTESGSGCTPYDLARQMEKRVSSL